MRIIADSGSTKTAWADMETGKRTVTEGLNPHFSDENTFIQCCNQVREALKLNDAEVEILFYGSGCGSTLQRERVRKLLRDSFNASKVTVETDMLGACRATAANEPALVGILGTGSNICYYDGKEIRIQPISTGYILGDEGSANHVGRLLLKDYLTDKMPSSLSLMFLESYQLSKAELLEKLYHEPHANRWLASLAQFVTRNAAGDSGFSGSSGLSGFSGNGYCVELLNQSIGLWVSSQLLPLYEETKCKNLYLVGGFAECMKDIVEKKLKDSTTKNANITLKDIISDPIDSLLRYHKS